MEVNLISDTVTKPGQAMLAAMMNTEVGDDVFGQDPTVNALEAKVASMFGHEDALFCPSGTMTNQIAIQLHTGALGEVICEENAHIFQFETGGYAHNARASVNLVKGTLGLMSAQQVNDAVRPVFDWLPTTKMVTIENSCNKGGGTMYSLQLAREIGEVCDKHGLAYHLDGARLFNVLAETRETPAEWGLLFDTISICLSKGLGAPVGSLLIGSKEVIRLGRRFRKVMGGGMRQVGILAAAGIYALDNNIPLLKVDNDRAKVLGDALAKCSWIKQVRPVQTNIVIGEMKDDRDSADLVETLRKKQIHTVAMGKNLIRLVTHLDLTTEMIQHSADLIASL